MSHYRQEFTASVNYAIRSQTAEKQGSRWRTAMTLLWVALVLFAGTSQQSEANPSRGQSGHLRRVSILAQQLSVAIGVVGGRLFHDTVDIHVEQTHANTRISFYKPDWNIKFAHFHKAEDLLVRIQISKRRVTIFPTAYLQPHASENSQYTEYARAAALACSYLIEHDVIHRDFEIDASYGLTNHDVRVEKIPTPVDEFIEVRVTKKDGKWTVQRLPPIEIPSTYRPLSP